MQISTPVHGSAPQQAHSGGESQYSPLHDSLYLFLARILRPVWATPLVKEEVDGNKSSVIFRFICIVLF